MASLTMQAILLSLINSVLSTKINAVDNKNIYMQLVQMTAKHANRTGCYICGLIPHSAAHGFPMMSVPVTPKYNSVNSGSNEIIVRSNQRLDDQPVNIVLSLGPYPWCVKQNGSAFVGETVDCHKVIDNQTLPEVYHTAVGVYWICGNNAYSHLPSIWSGICALGHLVPAMRIVSSLPDRIRYQRSTDLLGTHHQSMWKRALGALLPTYGVMSALDQIGDLSKEVEILANNTALGLSKISEELTAVRLIALQNRAALDYLLSAQGGTCKIIGIECCSYIPNNNDDLQKVISNIHNVSRVVHEISTISSSGFFNWITKYVGDLGKIAVEYIFLALIGLTLFTLLIKVMKIIIIRLICSTTKKNKAQAIDRTSAAHLI